MTPAQVIAILLSMGVQVYTTAHGNSGNVDLVTKLIAVAQTIGESITKVTALLQQAQAEGWPEGDARYLPLFADAHAAIAAAEAAL